MNIEIRHLRYFLAVAEELSFTRAAGRLRVSQPSLTRAVGALERATGTALLHRSTRSVSLTPEGERLMADATRLVRDFDRLVGRAAHHSALRLGFAWVLPDPWAQQAIDLFEQECGVRVEPVRRDKALAGVDSGETDVAVLRGDLEAPGLHAVPLFQERRIAAVHRRSALGGRSALDWVELAGQPLVVNVVSGTTRPEQWPAERRPTVAVRCENFDEWVEAVAADRGFGVVPVSAAHRVIHPAIRFISLRGAPPVPVRIAYPRQGSHPFARSFVQAALRAPIPPHAIAPDTDGRDDLDGLRHSGGAVANRTSDSERGSTSGSGSPYRSAARRTR